MLNNIFNAQEERLMQNYQDFLEKSDEEQLDFLTKLRQVMGAPEQVEAMTERQRNKV
jgi:hypothetical protein